MRPPVPQRRVAVCRVTLFPTTDKRHAVAGGGHAGESRSAIGMALSLMQSKLHVDLRWFQIETTAVATTAVAATSPLSWHIPRPSLVGRSERDSENGSWAHHLHPNSPSRGSTSSQGSTASTHVNFLSFRTYNAQNRPDFKVKL